MISPYGGGDVCEECGRSDNGLYVIESGTPRETTLCRVHYAEYANDPKDFFTEEVNVDERSAC